MREPLSADTEREGRVVLVTGASGFIGRDLVQRLSRSGWRVRAAQRGADPEPVGAGVACVRLPDLSQPVDWSPLLDDVTHVVHLAGIAHATATIPEATYQAVNAEAVRTLAEASRRAGLKRVVLMSSVRAQCGPSAGQELREEDEPAPVDSYGRSKLQGERWLAEALAGSQTDWTVLRPVVVYGQGVKGNVAALLKLAQSPVPLPLGSFAGKRSVLGLANLAAGVEYALHAETASRRVFLLADPEPLTLGEIIGAMREGMGRRSGVVTVPLAALKAVATVAGKRDAWERIAGDLVVSTAALEASGWRPVAQSRDGLAAWTREAHLEV